METIKVGNIKYQISFIDTAETIKNMIAAKEKLPYNYIRFKKFNLAKKIFDLETIPELLKDVEIGDLKNVIDKAQEEWGIPASKLALEWLRIHYDGKLDEGDIIVIDEFKKINPTDFWGHYSIMQLYKFYPDQQKNALSELQKTVTLEQEYREKYNNYTPVETTKFLQDSVVIRYDITINYDPLEAFDSITLSQTIPYAKLKTADQSYYKTIKSFTPSEEWLDSDTTMMFKINQGDNNGWGTATIDYTTAEEPYKAIMIVEANVKPGSKKNTTEDIIKNSLIGLFDGAGIKINNREEQGIKGVFAVPELVISKPIFLDILTNEPMVSHYLYVDENRDLSSQKSVLYLYYSPGYDPDPSQVLTSFLSDRVVSRSDIFYDTKELPLFTPYLNVRVSRALNLDQINRFKTAFGIILDIYNKKFDAIAKQYKKMIPSFEAVKQRPSKKNIESKKLKALQSLDSELFIHGYPTNCEQKRQPMPVSKKDSKKWINKGHQVMNYPKGSTNFFVCSKDGKQSFNYPGLLVNKLSNSEEYPYLPCCYANNQRVGIKLLNRYEQNLIKTSAKSSNIVSKKIVRREKLGYLPRNIDYILHKNSKPGEKFYRQGVAQNNNSFIEAVMLGIDPYYQDDFQDNEKNAYVSDVRANLAALDTAAVIQELYDSSADQITKDILNPDVVFDSKIFTGLLEVKYQCQIVVFVRTDAQPNGEFEIPRYTQGYLYRKLDPNVPTVLIYKHMGSRSDNLSTPHYELIVKKYKKLTTWHLQNDLLIRQIYSFFLRTYRLYSIGIGRYNAISTPPNKFNDAIGQYIDRYGKTRGYLFDNDIYIATSPLPPANNIPMTETPDKRPTQKNVMTFIKKNGLTINQQDIINNKAVGVKLFIPGIPYVYIPFIPSPKLSAVKEGSQLGHSIPTDDDILEKTLDNRKIADFLMQLLLYSFSIWFEDKKDTAEYKKFQENNEDLPTANKQVAEKNQIASYINKFLTTRIIINPDHDYRVTNLPRRLSLNNTFFQNNKLIADSQTTANKLGYYLRFMVNKNKNLVFNYSSRTYLDNYYTYSADFIHHDKQLIFIGRLSIDNWINTQSFGISNQVHTIPHPYMDTPFFFSHWALNGGKPVIIQNVKNGDLKRALSVASTFTKENYNSGFNANRIKLIDHSIYYLKDGVLIRNGSSPLKIWQYTDNFYAAILLP